MPTAKWIRKEAFLEHRHPVPLRLLGCDPDVSAGNQTSVKFYAVELAFVRGSTIRSSASWWAYSPLALYSLFAGRQKTVGSVKMKTKAVQIFGIAMVASQENVCSTLVTSVSCAKWPKYRILT